MAVMAVKRNNKIKLLCLVIILIFLVLETLYIISRHGEHTACNPFSHRIFRINADTVESIMIMHGGSGKTVVIEGEELESLIKELNEKKYIIAIPYIDFGFVGWETRFTVKTDRNTDHFIFTHNSVRIKGFIYIFSGNTFNFLLDYIE